MSDLKVQTELSRLQDLLGSLPRLEVSEPKREFTVFLSLASELRNHVRDFAAIDSRDIFVYHVNYRGDRNDELQKPAILFACHEARAQALRHYQLVQETSVSPPSQSTFNHRYLTVSKRISAPPIECSADPFTSTFRWTDLSSDEFLKIQIGGSNATSPRETPPRYATV